MRAKKTKDSQTGKFSGLKIINHDVAGIDVGATLMQVCVPSDRSTTNNRAFGTCTGDLRQISVWLRQCRITKVIMESTGIYWVQLFRMLQQDGFEVYLVNAADAKNMSGRKTDVDDAEWLMVLLAYGMFKPCYQSDAASRKLRTYTRLREQYVEMSSTAVQRMQKSLELMNVKLTEVLSNIAGVSGLRMIEDILAGERDPGTLASYADIRCKAGKEEIMASVEGTWDDDHMFALSLAYEDYKAAQSKIAQCDKKIEDTAASMTVPLDMPEEKRVKSGKRQYKKNSMAVNVEEYCYRAFGVNIMAIPSISHSAALTILAELGSDFVRKFPTANKFAKWCNLVPNDKITGGKIVSSKMLKRKNKVGQALRQSAMALSRSKDALGAYYRRIKARTGGIQA
ncbi:IS110 family transposase, partial [Parabacteroides sp. ZJ-118]|uniref:IS110 family transposase n=1 Tax=Parabacteroides sp. ZJ-118 TaxID=2709398 RepID=UPI0013ED3965